MFFLNVILTIGLIVCLFQTIGRSAECKHCQGTGVKDGCICPFCNGTGKE